MFLLMLLLLFLYFQFQLVALVTCWFFCAWAADLSFWSPFLGWGSGWLLFRPLLGLLLLLWGLLLGDGEPDDFRPFCYLPPNTIRNLVRHFSCFRCCWLARLWCRIFARTRFGPVSLSTTCPAVETTLKHWGSPQNTPRQCNLQDKISSSNSSHADCCSHLIHYAVLGKKAPILYTLISTGTPCTVIFVRLVDIYPVWRLTDLVVRVLPANILASSSVACIMSHSALDLPAKILGPILRTFKASSIVTLLTIISLRVSTSVISSSRFNGVYCFWKR